MPEIDDAAHELEETTVTSCFDSADEAAATAASVVAVHKLADTLVTLDDDAADDSVVTEAFDGDIAQEIPERVVAFEKG